MRWKHNKSMEQYSEEQLHTIKRLKTLRPEVADSAYLRAVRARLLATVEHEQHLIAQPWSAFVFRFSVRGIVAVMIAGVLGAGASFASQYILPNNFLYPIKLAAERAQLTLAGDGAASRIALQSRFAQTRITEIQSLESANQLDVQAVSSALGEYMQAIDQIASTSERIARSQDVSVLAQLTQSEAQARDLDAKINVLASSLQDRQLPQAITDQVQSAARASYALRLGIADEIMGYEASHQTFAGDARFVSRVLFVLSDDQAGLNALSDAATQRIQADAHVLMQEQSIQNPNIAPEKLAITLPQADVQLQQALAGIEGEISALEAKLGSAGASFNDSEMLDILGRVAGIKNALEQANALLSK